METLLRNEVKLQDYVDTAFKKLFFNVPQNEKPEYNGVQLINSAVIARYLKQLLQNDLRYAPFTFIASEMEVDEPIDIQTPKGVIKSRIGGIIDRMDSKDGTLRIVDYKTGGDADTHPCGISVYSGQETFQLCIPDVPVCRHHVPQATNDEDSSGPSLYSSGRYRNLFSRYTNGRATKA